MTYKKPMLIEDGYAYLSMDGYELRTTRLREDRYVRVDDGREYRQLCAGAARTGPTLVYLTDEDLARDCGARLYKTRRGYERARARDRANNYAAYYS